VAEYLRESAKAADGCWARFEKEHPGDARAQLQAWLKEMASHVANTDERGCALANAAVELPDKNHPARRVIEECKAAQRTRLVQLCDAAELSEPDMLADELHLCWKARASRRKASVQAASEPASFGWVKR